MADGGRGSFSVLVPAAQARALLASALELLQRDRAPHASVTLAVSQVAAASTYLYQAEAKARTLQAALQGIRAAAEHLDAALRALNGLRAGRPDCEVAAAAIARASALLYPIVQASLRQRRGVHFAHQLTAEDTSAVKGLHDSRSGACSDYFGVAHAGGPGHPLKPGTTMSTSSSATPRLSVQELRNIGLFGALNDEVLVHLAEVLTVDLPEAGETLFREGEAANAMFVVVGGEMEVLKRSRSGIDARVAVLGPGDWFGEMSIVDIQPRSATVRALAPGRLVRITPADLDALYRFDVRSYAIIVLNLARELSRRLRVADGILADLIANVMDSYVGRPRSGGG